MPLQTPIYSRPSTSTSSKAGETWRIEDPHGELLAFLYRSKAAATFMAEISVNSPGEYAGYILGLGRLPKTRPSASGPYTFDEIRAEVVAILRDDGWTFTGGVS